MGSMKAPTDEELAEWIDDAARHPGEYLQDRVYWLGLEVRRLRTERDKGNAAGYLRGLEDAARSVEQYGDGAWFNSEDTMEVYYARCIRALAAKGEK